MLTAYTETFASRRFQMMGVEIHVRVAGEETDGRLTVLEQIVSPGAGSPPHTIEGDKIFLVLDGAVEIVLGNEARIVEAGGVGLAPAGTPHCFRNRGASAARILVLVTPGGHERFLAEAAASGSAFPEVAARHGVRLLQEA